MSEPRHIGIVLFDGVEELDAVGPWEVLGLWLRAFPGTGWSLSTVAVGTGGAHDVRCALGLRATADHTAATAPRYDVLVHPGGPGTRAQVTDDEHLGWVRERRAEVGLMTSVCTGSLVYAAAGLLHDRPATTHRAALDHLAELDPTIRVRPDAPFVDDGDVVTSAGIAAGIDMALHLVARLGDPEQSATVRNRMWPQA